MRIQSVFYIMIELIILDLHAKGAERICAKPIVVQTAVLDISIYVD